MRGIGKVGLVSVRIHDHRGLGLVLPGDRVWSPQEVIAILLDEVRKAGARLRDQRLLAEGAIGAIIFGQIFVALGIGRLDQEAAFGQRTAGRIVVEIIVGPFVAILGRLSVPVGEAIGVRPGEGTAEAIAAGVKRAGADLAVAVDIGPLVGDDTRLDIGRICPDGTVRERLADHLAVEDRVGDLAAAIARRRDAIYLRPAGLPAIAGRVRLDIGDARQQAARIAIARLQARPGAGRAAGYIGPRKVEAACGRNAPVRTPVEHKRIARAVADQPKLVAAVVREGLHAPIGKHDTRYTLGGGEPHAAAHRDRGGESIFRARGIGIDIVAARQHERADFGIHIGGDLRDASRLIAAAGACAEMDGEDRPSWRLDRPADIYVEIAAGVGTEEQAARIVQVAADIEALELERPDRDIGLRIGERRIGKVHARRGGRVDLGRDDLGRRGYRAEHRRGREKQCNMPMHSGLHQEFGVAARRARRVARRCRRCCCRWR